jgi:hypothetical protein
MVSVAVEGSVDEAVVRRLCGDCRLSIADVYVTNGKARLDERLKAYNHAARHAPWLVLRDLDHDAQCPAELRSRLLSAEASGMRLRVSVRAVEAWLLADRAGIARYLGVATAKVPGDPERLDRPKQTLVNLARKSSKRTIREDLVPPKGYSTMVGPRYTTRLQEFANEFWDLQVAMAVSDSLRRCVAAIQSLR